MRYSVIYPFRLARRITLRLFYGTHSFPASAELRRAFFNRAIIGQFPI
jgi:hypothetical protein